MIEKDQRVRVVGVHRLKGKVDSVTDDAGAAYVVFDGHELVDALGLKGGGPSPQHCGFCGYGWSESYGRGDDGVMRPQTYDPSRPCRGCDRVGAVCKHPAEHAGDHELAS